MIAKLLPSIIYNLHIFNLIDILVIRITKKIIIMSNITNKPNTAFWIIAVIALIWNLMGVYAYIVQVNMTPEVIAALPEAEQSLYENVPTWVTGAFAIAVFGGSIGCILLLLKKKLATPVLIISLIGVIAQMVYNFGMSKAAEVYGPGGMVMPAMVVLIGIFLIWYSKQVTAKGWLS